MRNPNGNGCIPKCTPECKHGTCIAPDKCKCDHGYGGPACGISSYWIINNFIFCIMDIHIT